MKEEKLQSEEFDEVDPSQLFEKLITKMDVLSDLLNKNEQLTQVITHYNDDLLRLKSAFHQTISQLEVGMNKVTSIFEKEVKSRQELFEKSPKLIQVDWSDEAIQLQKKYEQKNGFYEKIVRYSVILSLISMVIMFTTFYVTKSWYKQSIRTKEEIRSDLLYTKYRKMAK